MHLLFIVHVWPPGFWLCGVGHQATMVSNRKSQFTAHYPGYTNCESIFQIQLIKYGLPLFRVSKDNKILFDNDIRHHLGDSIQTSLVLVLRPNRYDNLGTLLNMPNEDLYRLFAPRNPKSLFYLSRSPECPHPDSNPRSGSSSAVNDQSQSHQCQTKCSWRTPTCTQIGDCDCGVDLIVLLGISYVKKGAEAPSVFPIKQMLAGCTCQSAGGTRRSS